MKIKLRGLVQVAKKHGLYIRAIKLNERSYITGQGIIPGNPDTSDGLTFDEMTGKERLSREKILKYPLIIDPLKQYHFKDGHTFDLDTPEGVAMFNFVKIVSSGNVAESKDNVVRGEHKFYLENKVAESKTKFDKYSKSIEAGIKLQKLNQGELLGLANYIFVNFGENRCNNNQPVSIITSTLFEYAHEKPKIILDSLSKDNKLNIVVAEFVTKGIITRRNGEYYEGNVYIATSFENLVELYRTDATKSGRWDSKMNKLSRDIHSTFDSPILDSAKIKADLLEAFVDKDIVKYNEVVTLITKSNNKELMELLVKYKLEIEPIEEPIKSATDLLRLVYSESNWFIFFKQFTLSFPDSSLTKKDEIIEFLKGN